MKGEAIVAWKLQSRPLLKALTFLIFFVSRPLQVFQSPLQLIGFTLISFTVPNMDHRKAVILLLKGGNGDSLSAHTDALLYYFFPVFTSHWLNGRAEFQLQN